MKRVEKVLHELTEAGLIRGQKNIVHTVNVHERCKKEIEFIVVPQWFIAVFRTKKSFLHSQIRSAGILRL